MNKSELTFMKLFRVFLVFIVAALLLNSCAREIPNTDLKHEHLFGPVKSVKEISYQLIKVNGKYKQGKRKRRFDHVEDFYWEFNELGDFKSSQTLSRDGVKYSKYNYQYDSLNRLLYNYTISKKGDTVVFERYFYNANNQCIMDKSDYMVHKYYYRHNRLFCEFIYTSPGDKRPYDRVFKHIYFYDENGFLKLDCGYYYGARWYLYHLYTNDNKGNVLDYRYSIELSDLKEEIPTKYYYHKFDRYGNWIQKILIAYGHPKYVIKRKINYYPTNESFN